jgi:uncharacterized phiE125 gp8 family phage protein
MTLPVDLVDAKRQLRLEPEDTSQDAEIGGFVADAASWVENYTGHILEPRDVSEQFAGFGRMRLKAWPIAPDAVVTLAYDGPGVVTTITGARLSVASRPAVVLPPVSLAWPRLLTGTVVTVSVRAGYSSPALVPGNLRRAMLLLISGYDQGGADLVAAETTARTLCSDFRMRSL